MQVTSLHIRRKRNPKPTNEYIQCPIWYTYAALPTLLYCCVLSINSDNDYEDEFGFKVAKYRN